MPISLAGSKKPSTPTVVLIASRPLALAACGKLACNKSLAIVIGDSRLAKKLLIRVREVGFVTLR